MTDHPHLLFLCTGNAARSVMAGAWWANRHPGVAHTTAGTFVIEGQPMSWRTKAALDDLGLPTIGHRSHQLVDADIAVADLVVVMERDHVTYVRRTHPEAAGRTATLHRLARDLPAGGLNLADRLAALALAVVDIEDWEDVSDPAGKDVDAYHACAVEIAGLMEQLDQALRSPSP